MNDSKLLSPEVQTYNIKGTIENVLNLRNIKLKDALNVDKNGYYTREK